MEWEVLMVVRGEAVKDISKAKRRDIKPSNFPRDDYSKEWILACIDIHMIIFSNGFTE